MEMIRKQYAHLSAPAQARSGLTCVGSSYRGLALLSKPLSLLRRLLCRGSRPDEEAQAVAPPPDPAEAQALAEMRRLAGPRQPGLYVSLLRPEAERHALDDVRPARLELVHSTGERSRG